jgi:hypothetical protein
MKRLVRGSAVGSVDVGSAFRWKAAPGMIT